MLEQLTSYLLAFMLSWSPLTIQTMKGEPADVAETRYESIAHDIAQVVTDPDELPLYDADASDVAKSSAGRAHGAVVLLAIAFMEDSFRAYVDDGRCNDPAWRATEIGKRTMASGGNCDGGWAFSMWQIHAESGIVLSGPVWRPIEGAKDIDVAIEGHEMVRDRKVAIRVALHFVRKSFIAQAGLCQYTGEYAPCPKARLRLGFANQKWHEKPFELAAASP